MNIWRLVSAMAQGWAAQHAPAVWFLKVDCEATAPNQALARIKGIRCRGLRGQQYFMGQLHPYLVKQHMFSTLGIRTQHD